MNVSLRSLRLTSKPWNSLGAVAGIALAVGCGTAQPAAAPQRDRGAPASIRWRRVHHETFDAPFAQPPWIEDTYGDASPYHVDMFDEDEASRELSRIRHDGRMVAPWVARYAWNVESCSAGAQRNAAG